METKTKNRRARELPFDARASRMWRHLTLLLILMCNEMEIEILDGQKRDFPNKWGVTLKKKKKKKRVNANAVNERTHLHFNSLKNQHEGTLSYTGKELLQRSSCIGHIE